jgi:integrase
MAKATRRPTGPTDANYDPVTWGSDEDVDEHGVDRGAVASPPLVGAAFDAYMLAHNYRKSVKNTSCIVSAFNEFLTATKLHENLSLWDITKETGRQWIAYMKTPKKFPARAIPKAVTVDVKVKQLRHFLAYCVSQDWLESNAFADLALPSRIVTASRLHKEPFTDAELVTIFQALKNFLAPDPRWTGTITARTEFYYVVLLLAFSGARCNEIVQLHREDVKQVDGLWCVDLCEGSGKRLKNSTSRRKVPLHSQLLPVLLPWITRQTGTKLFPSLEGSNLVSRWFSKGILLPSGLKRPALSLHSLRHTLTHKLIHARTYAPLQNRLLGHALGKTVEMTSYTRGLEFSVKELSEAIEAVKFPMVSSLETLNVVAVSTVVPVPAP